MYTPTSSEPRGGNGLERVGTRLGVTHPKLIASKRRMRKVESIECVRLNRESACQNLGFSSRPFVLCGLPVKRPAQGCLLHERRNGRFVLQVTGHPSYGLPWGQDRLVPIFLATLAIRQRSPQITFDSAAAMLDTFGMQQGGSQYRRLVSSFQRIFGATIFFGTDTQRQRATVVHQARFNFMTEARIWFLRNCDQSVLPGDCQNMIVLSEEFYRETLSHPIPTDLEAAKALSSSPAALDLFTWLSYRCFGAKGEERVPLFGDFGLVSQLGSVTYSRPRKFREKLDQWLDLVRIMWPACPARISPDGSELMVARATAIRAEGFMIMHEPSFAAAKRIPLETIDAAVCARLGRARVAGNSQPAAFNRQVAMYLAKHVGGWSTTRIEKFYNGRDHSTVCHSIKRVQFMRDGDAALDALLRSMANDLRSIEPKIPDHDESRSSGSSSGPLFEEIFIESLVGRIVDRVVDRLSAQISGRLAGNG